MKETDTNVESTEQFLLLDTSLLVEPEATNVRPWSHRQGDTEEEIKAISDLAATIEEEGQLQPVKARRVMVNGGGGEVFELVLGRRRKRAIELINAGKKAGEEIKIKVLVVDQLSDPSAFRQAAIENWHRKGLSPMDMCEDIRTVRENFKWEGKKGTKKVAEFFKVSPATITQYETLGALPDKLKGQVHSGEMSRDDAFRVAVIAEKKGLEAAMAAVVEADAAAEVVDAPAHAHETPGEETARKKSKKAKAAKSSVIKKKKREADPDAKEPRSKKEIMEFFTSCYGPAYGHPNGAVHQFVDALEKYAAGVLSDRTLYKYWDACVDKAPKGTEVKVQPVEEKPVKAVKPARKKK